MKQQDYFLQRACGPALGAARTVCLCVALAMVVPGAGLFAKGAKDAPASAAEGGKERVTILLAAAASLKNVFDNELIPAFTTRERTITVEATYDSSGKLQTQIEGGLPADLFFSASTKQMDALEQGGYVAAGTRRDLLQNSIVLIKGAGVSTQVTGFATLTKAATIAVGDPASVPAGQYAKEALEALGLWAEVAKRASLGTNVTEVLNQVAAGSAEVGIVYGTDAASKSAEVEVLAECPAGLLASPPVYPVAVLVHAEASPSAAEAARLFLAFLESENALAVFKTYGFAEN